MRQARCCHLQLPAMLRSLWSVCSLPSRSSMRQQGLGEPPSRTELAPYFCDLGKTAAATATSSTWARERSVSSTWGRKKKTRHLLTVARNNTAAETAPSATKRPHTCWIRRPEAYMRTPTPWLAEVGRRKASTKMAIAWLRNSHI